MYKSKLLLVVLGISIIYITGYGQKKSAKYPSLLWEITGNGLTKPSYLFGTMHVSSKLVFKFDIGKYVRILRLSLGIACGESKDNAAVGARLYSLFLPFIQLWCESNFAIT